MFSGFLVHCRGAGTGVQETSMTISIRRGKGRSIDAYSTAHWLKSINNKTTQCGARWLVHCRSNTNQLCFPVLGEIFILLTLLWSNYRSPVCLLMPLRISLCEEVQSADLKEMLRVFRNRSPFLFPSPPPLIHPPLPLHHLPHLSLQCCRSESVWRRGMYVHTNTGRAVIPPTPTQERLLPALRILIK